MKKNILISLLTIVYALCLSYCLLACANNDDSLSKHKHSYQWADNGDGTHKQHCSVSGCDAPDINIENHIWNANDKCEKCKASMTNNNPSYLLTFNTLQLGENDTVYGKVSNSTETFSFIKEITANDGTTYTISTDIIGNQTIPTKTVPLEIGDNTFYILAQNENNAALFTVTIRRRPVYIVTYNTDGGSVVSTQHIEEDNAVSSPTTTKTGYTLENWTVNNVLISFPYAIMEDTEFNAVFAANNYTITLDANGGEIATTTQSLTYDNSYTLPVPMRLGYTFIGWYDGENQVTNADGESLCASQYIDKTIFTAHWQINRHQLNVSYNNSAGSVAGIETGIFDYNTKIFVEASESNLGYNWLGWYDGDIKLSEDKSYTFLLPDKNVDLIAKWEIIPAIELFNFTSSTDTCTITGLKDTTISVAIIPNFVTSIGQYAFFRCTSLTSITIPNSVQSIETCAFNGCKGLKDITIPDSVQIIENSAFVDCIGISSVTIPFVGARADGTGATNFGYIFGASSWSYNSKYVPSLLNTVIITGGNTIGDNAFFGCSHLTNITISNSVTSIMSSAFGNCSGLKSITLSDSITSIEDYTFSGCTNLSSITIPQNVTSIGLRAFDRCSSLTSIIIPNGVTNVGNVVFDGCGSITIYCQAQSKPSGWSENWSYGVKNIIWGYEE